MSREVKRVPMDFDWPIGRIWLPYMSSICTAEVDYCLRPEAATNLDDQCEVCRHAARLIGRPMKTHGCPNWKHDPPAGEGWQMWETTTEGSPMSPVFATPEELARWLADNNASTFGDMTARYEAWLGMITGGGSCPSAVVDSKGLRSGVEMVAEQGGGQ